MDIFERNFYIYLYITLFVILLGLCISGKENFPLFLLWLISQILFLICFYKVLENKEISFIITINIIYLIFIFFSVIEISETNINIKLFIGMTNLIFCFLFCIICAKIFGLNIIFFLSVLNFIIWFFLIFNKKSI